LIWHQVWTGFTVHLIENYGKRKVLAVAKENRKSDYHEKFVELFRRTEREEFREYLNSVMMVKP
jgi:hypothetical protein